MTEKILKATHMGSLDIGEISIPCAVLEDGTRVLTQAGFLAAMGRVNRAPGKRGPSTEGNLPFFIAAQNLQPFISADLQEATVPIIFKPINPTSGHKGRAYGYRAELLPAVCNVFLSARDAGVLVDAQKHIAKKCDLLIRGLATVGIVALVDEATGYQAVRARNELNKILEVYIAKELLPWTKRFPDEFYKEMFRLKGWEYNAMSVKRPRVVGTLTNKIVYKRLPPGVLEELKEKNPAINGRRKHKHFQFLTEEIGHPHLTKHLAAVTALMRASSTWRNFEGLLEKAFPIVDVEYKVIPGMEDLFDENEEED